MIAAISEKMTDLLGSSSLQGHAVLLHVETDIDETGHASKQQLLVTEKEIAIVKPDETEDTSFNCSRTLPLDQIDGCRVQAEVGSGYLQVKQGDKWVDLMRFSNRLASDFREAAHKLERLRRYREFLIEDAEEKGRVCVRCGRRLHCPGELCDRCTPPLKTVQRILGLLRPFAGMVALISGLSVATIALELVPPWLQKVLVDALTNKNEGQLAIGSVLGTLGAIIGCLAIVRLTTALLTIAKAKFSSDVGTRLTADLRNRMVEKLQHLPVSYHDRNEVGTLMSLVAYDTEAMHTMMHQLSGGFLLQVLQMLAIGSMLFVLNAKLALWALMPAPFVLLASWFFCRYLYVQHHRYWDAVGRQAVALTSLLSGIRVVKAFTQESRESARFGEASERLRSSRVDVDLATATFSSLVGFCFGLGGLAVWYIGGRDVFGNQMTLGSLMAFLAYLSMFYAPLTTVSEGATWISSFLAASHRIFALLDTPTAEQEPAEPQRVEQMRGHIQFEGVTFSYDGQSPAVEDLNFEIQPGESIGVVGRSGSGKSTLVCLISRLYNADSGSIKIDGIDIRRISSGQLRRQVGMVLQEPFLFEGTVSGNIAYGDPHAPPEKILTSAKAAGAHDFIMRMPFGYDTPLGERGAGLSGGERQRVSIARAVLYDPKILILDEATSSVDTESERLIQTALERFAKGRTTLAIAHRLSTLENANRLLLLDHGHLAEQGTHRELLEKDGIYAQLVRQQFAGLSDDQQAELLAAHGNQSSSPEEDLPEPEWQIHWLDPARDHIEVEPPGLLTLHRGDETFQSVFTVRAFPATYSEEFLSLRRTELSGRDRELGMIRNLRDWPIEIQDAVRRSLNRRYLLRVLRSLVSLRSDDGFITCSADTEDGPVEFVIHNNPHCIKRFGYQGRLLTDIDDNHYLIPDVDGLPLLQRRMFKRQFQEL